MLELRLLFLQLIELAEQLKLNLDDEMQLENENDDTLLEKSQEQLEESDHFGSELEDKLDETELKLNS